LLKQVSLIGIEASRHLRATKAHDVKGIIEFERKADRVVDEIHELLDNAFIMRFDIADMLRLTDELDDVVDGMRKVALHMDGYKPFLTELRPGADKLMALTEQMLLDVDKLVDMLAEPKLDLQRVRTVADKIDEMESQADSIVADHERELVAQFSAPGSNALGFIAQHQLFHMLEQMTDDANHCAKLIVSLARKEA
jgi:uncharacterized protein